MCRCAPTLKYKRMEANKMQSILYFTYRCRMMTHKISVMLTVFKAKRLRKSVNVMYFIFHIFIEKITVRHIIYSCFWH